MAEAPQVELVFDETQPGTVRRVIQGLPEPLPEVGEDFDYRARDYDALRIFMLEELAARAPERRRWTPADLEVVLVEVLAAVLDQLSDMVDRVAAETWLETARRPESVRRLLGFIGYDAVQAAKAARQIAGRDAEATEAKELERLWRDEPWLMEQARAAGPREIRALRRMVTVEDYGRKLEEHPLVLRASATLGWGGAWPVVQVAVLLWGGSDRSLESDATPEGLGEDLQAAVESFHVLHGAPVPEWIPAPTVRHVLLRYVDACRMVGQEVELIDPIPVGIELWLSVGIQRNYFQSEVRIVVEQVLGKAPGGFFEPGRLRFGEDIHMSDIIAALMALDGVESVAVERFKRFGAQYSDEVSTGRIQLSGIEIAVCDGDRTRPERGDYKLVLQGGQQG
jgi:hypothetical protein